MSLAQVQNLLAVVGERFLSGNKGPRTWDFMCLQGAGSEEL